MRTIIPNQTFKHETETYEAGQEYEVCDAEAEYFEEAGWVGERTTRSESHSLAIDDVMLGHSVA